MDKPKLNKNTWIWIIAAIATGFLTTLGGFLFNYTQNLIAPHSDVNDAIEVLDEAEYIPQRIENVFVHCTATYTDWSKQKLLDFFKKSRRWDKPGYHYYIRFDGSIDTLVHLNDDALIQYDEIAYGARGNNSKSIHISYSGGIDINGKAKDTRTEMQKQTINLLVHNFKYKYPWVKIYGHRQVSAKSCPSFDSKKEFEVLNNYKPQY